MPTYEYRCAICGWKFEIEQSYDEDPLTDCAMCESVGSLRKLYSNFTMRFKGKGFYSTDSS